MSLRVVTPGLLTTVQDLGRHGYQHLGVPVCGALDPVSLRAANARVDNAPGAACVEVAYVGPTFAVEADSVRAAHRHAEMLVSVPPEVLHRGQQAGRDDAQAHAAASTVSSPGTSVNSPAATCATRRSYSRSETGATLTLSPGRSSAPPAASHSRTGERPIRCQPHGVSCGKMQVMAIAIASEPAGIFIRGVARRGSMSSSATSPM